MQKNAPLPSIICFGLVLLFSIWATPNASAYKLTYFYDPDTGNVSFDTAETRTGEILIYQLKVYPELTSIRFRPENHVALTVSSLKFANEYQVEETTISTPMKGLLTIGDVLPTGISEEVWLNRFPSVSFGHGQYGTTGYSPGFGMPYNDPVEYVYGRPNREFDNRWDIVDPDTLVWATEASLIYRESSGEVILDTSGTNSGYISGINLGSNNEFLHENFTPPQDLLYKYGFDDRIAMLGDAIEPGLYSIGNILESGLTKSEYESLFTWAKFYGRRGFSGDLDLETEGSSFSLVYVSIPEPTSAIFITMAGMAILSSRRKSFF